jgi:hypothetical protein
MTKGFKCAFEELSPMGRVGEKSPCVVGLLCTKPSTDVTISKKQNFQPNLVTLSSSLSQGGVDTVDASRFRFAAG